jgi:hypothetical protein
MPRMDFTTDNKGLFGKFVNYCKAHAATDDDFMNFFLMVIEEGRSIDKAREITLQYLTALQAKKLVKLDTSKADLSNLNRIEEGQFIVKILPQNLSLE